MKVPENAELRPLNPPSKPEDAENPLSKQRITERLIVLKQRIVKDYTFDIECCFVAGFTGRSDFI